jgi:hypothetical protein
VWSLSGLAEHVVSALAARATACAEADLAASRPAALAVAAALQVRPSRVVPRRPDRI